MSYSPPASFEMYATVVPSGEMARPVLLAGTGDDQDRGPAARGAHPERPVRTRSARTPTAHGSCPSGAHAGGLSSAGERVVGDRADGLPGPGVQQPHVRACLRAASRPRAPRRGRAGRRWPRSRSIPSRRRYTGRRGHRPPSRTASGQTVNGYRIVPARSAGPGRRRTRGRSRSSTRSPSRSDRQRLRRRSGAGPPPRCSCATSQASTVAGTKKSTSPWASTGSSKQTPGREPVEPGPGRLAEGDGSAARGGAGDRHHPDRPHPAVAAAPGRRPRSHPRPSMSGTTLAAAGTASEGPRTAAAASRQARSAGHRRVDRHGERRQSTDPGDDGPGPRAPDARCCRLRSRPSMSAAGIGWCLRATIAALTHARGGASDPAGRVRRPRPGPAAEQHEQRAGLGRRGRQHRQPQVGVRRRAATPGGGRAVAR